ncbi:MAG: hypothetical protein FJ090_01195 [Deltaproteobacteria bacterium]|nr:hypothetical protein [Deltaproteobacteria bacterium]
MRRRGQSAVEAMLVVPIIAMAIMVMYYLWSVAWAVQNAHIRARECVLHGDRYAPADEPCDAPFTASNYTRANSTTFRFAGGANDRTLSVFGRAETIRTTAVITSTSE